MSAPLHEIIIAQSQAEIQQCYDVRIAVFHHEQKFPLETEIDEQVSSHAFDPTATHFLLRLTPSLAPVGTIRAYQAPGGYYKLSRLAVLKDFRSFKFGRELVLALHEWVRAHAHAALSSATAAASSGPPQPAPQSVQIVSHSQIPVKGFYAKFGYQPEGAEFDEDGDPHQKMVLRLPL